MSASSMEAIKKQVEFYFSDSNYRKDTFLRAAAETDADGFVPLTVLLTFNKLKQLTEDPTVVAEAIKDCDFLVLNSAGDKVKRSQPLPEVDTSTERTLYAKGFPTNDSDVNIDSVSQLFSQFGKINMIKLRRAASDKKFKGSVMVEFSSVAEMQSALAAAVLDGVVQLSFKDQKLTQVCSFLEWHQEHKAFLASKRKGGEKRKNENIDESPSEAKEVEEKETGAADVNEEEEISFETGLLLRLIGLDSRANAVDLKNHLKTIADVKFIEIEKDGSALVRTTASAEADKIATAADAESGLHFDNKKLTVERVSGSQELLFWKRFNQRNKEGSGSGGRGGRGRGTGRGGGRGRGRGGGRGGDRGFKRQRR
jgi:lupus La protein